MEIESGKSIISFSKTYLYRFKYRALPSLSYLRTWGLFWRRRGQVATILALVHQSRLNPPVSIAFPVPPSFPLQECPVSTSEIIYPQFCSYTLSRHGSSYISQPRPQSSAYPLLVIYRFRIGFADFIKNSILSNFAGLYNQCFFLQGNITFVNCEQGSSLNYKLYQRILHFSGVQQTQLLPYPIFNINLQHVIQIMSDSAIRHQEQEQIPNEIIAQTEIDSEKQNKLLLSTLVEFYQKMRNPSSTQISQLETNFVDCQKKIIKVVEFRKDLQKSYQFSELNETHLEQIQKVQRNYSNYQQTISDLLKIIQKKQNYILELELQLNNFRLKQAQFKKRESVELRQFGRMQENFKQIKLTFVDFVKQLQKSHHLPEQANVLDENKQIRDFVRNKEILVESKAKFMEIRQQMIECAEVQRKKYTQSLKESVDLYEDVLKRKIDEQGSRNKNEKIKEQISVKEEEYNRLCRAQLTLYEKQLSKMQQLCRLAKDQLEKMESQLTEKDSVILLLESKLDSSQRLEQQNNSRVGSLNLIIEELNFTLKEREQQIKSYKTSIDIQENQLKQLLEGSQKYKKQLNLKEKQLSQLKKQYISMQNETIILKSELDSLREQNMANKSDLQKTKKSIKKEESKLVNETGRWGKEIQYLKNTLKLTQDENEKNRSQLNLLKKEIFQKQSQLRQLILKISLYQKQLAKLSSQNKQFKQLVDSVKRQLLQKNKEIQRLASQLEYLGQAMWELKQKSMKQQSKQNWDLIESGEGLQKIKQALEQEMDRHWVRSRDEFEKIIVEICDLVRAGGGDSKIEDLVIGL